MDNDVFFGAILAALAAGIASRRARDAVGRFVGGAVRRVRGLLPS
jgi:hypothetical protein